MFKQKKYSIQPFNPLKLIIIDTYGQTKNVLFFMLYFLVQQNVATAISPQRLQHKTSHPVIMCRNKVNLD